MLYWEEQNFLFFCLFVFLFVGSRVFLFFFLFFRNFVLFVLLLKKKKKNQFYTFPALDFFKFSRSFLILQPRSCGKEKKERSEWKGSFVHSRESSLIGERGKEG